MDVSISLSSIAHKSFIEVLLLEFGQIQRLTTSDITLRSSYLKCFNSGSTTYGNTSGNSRNSLACHIKVNLRFHKARVCVLHREFYHIQKLLTWKKMLTQSTKHPLSLQYGGLPLIISSSSTPNA